MGKQLYLAFNQVWSSVMLLLMVLCMLELLLLLVFFFLANEIYVISDMLHFFSQNQIFDLFLFHTVLFPLCSVPTYF